jgi:sugar phosphate isomerase/epimerase
MRYAVHLCRCVDAAAAMGAPVLGGVIYAAHGRLIGVHLDAYHMNIEEEEFGEPVRRVADRLVHFHLSESHRGIPGRGTVDWRAIVQALDDAEYDGYVGLESFAEVSPAMRRATCIWRDPAPDSDTLVREGLAFLKGLSRRPGASPRARRDPGGGRSRSSRG